MIAQSDRKIQKRFILSIILTSLILAAEVVGGLWSGSLALLSDAAHVFSDIFALALSYFALRLAARPPDDRHSFGWHRAEVIAALVNGASLLVIAIGIWVEAVKRWQAPLEIKGTEMLVIAIIGLVVNIIVAVILGGHDHTHDHPHDAHEKRNLNVHSAYLHVLGDLVSSIGVIAAAVIIQLTGARWIDPLISMVIGIIILVSAYRLLRSSLHILIEGVPEGLTIQQLNKVITNIEEVETVHDLHVWSLGSNQVSLSAHVVLSPENFRQQQPVLEKIRNLLAAEYGIRHTTLQFEETRCEDGCGGCN